MGLCVGYYIKIAYSDYQKDKQIEKLSYYFDFDSINRTPLERETFYILKSEFLACWLDSSNCYMKWHKKLSPDPAADKNAKFEGIKKTEVDNILHSENYDTLLVFAGYVATWNISGNDNSYSFFQAMKVTIDSTHKWHFNCLNDGPWYVSKGNTIKNLERDYKKYLVKSACLTDKNQLINSFFYKAFTEGIYPKKHNN